MFFFDDFIEKISCLDFNKIEDIYSINNLIITSYFENLRWTIMEMGIEHYMKYGCGLRDNFTVDDLIVANTYLNKEQLKLIFERMGDDFKYYAYGLPDLIVYNDKEFIFVEVKSKMDVPSFRQIQWHKFLTEVVGINVVLFMINKTGREIRNIEKSYGEKLLDSKKRKSIVNDMDLNKTFVNWDEPCLKSLMVVVDDKVFIRNFTSDLCILYKNAVNLYYADSSNNYKTLKEHLNRNKEAELLENEGDFFNAIKLYLENVAEKTTSTTTFKRLIYIFNKFNRYDDINKLMDIAIPIFISIGVKRIH